MGPYPPPKKEAPHKWDCFTVGSYVDAGCMLPSDGGANGSQVAACERVAREVLYPDDHRE